jgi:hypothetical protein
MHIWRVVGWKSSVLMSVITKARLYFYLHNLNCCHYEIKHNPIAGRDYLRSDYNVRCSFINLTG